MQYREAVCDVLSRRQATRINPRFGQISLLLFEEAHRGNANRISRDSRPGVYPGTLRDMRWALWLVTVLLMTGCAASEASPAPDFSLQLFDGTNFSLSEHLTSDRRPVLLNFWASWCGPCKEEMPALEAFSRAHPEILVVGIAVNDREQPARQLALELGVTYPTGIDADGAISDQFNYLGLPTSWLIGQDRRVIRYLAGALDLEELEHLVPLTA